MIALNRIEYNGYSSTDFDMILDCALDGDNSEVSTFLNREMIYSEKYNGTHRNIYQSKYNEVFAPKFTFIKNNFEEFSQNDHRRLLDWLTSKSTTSILSAYRDNSSVIDFECFGVWTEIQSYKIANGRVVAVTAIFETTSPYAYSPINTITRTISEPTTLTINCQSDNQSAYIYPRITIEEDLTSVVVNITPNMVNSIFNSANYIENTVYSDGTSYYWKKNNTNYGPLPTNTSDFDTTSVSIWNKTAGTKSTATIIKNRVRGEKIVLDGANEVITTGRTTVIGDDFNWNWMPLVIGDNTIEIIGNCRVTLEYREPIKCGDL